MATAGHQAQVNGQVVGAVGGGPLIEVAAIEPAVPVTVLAPGGIGVGVGPRALAGFYTLFLALADAFAMWTGAGTDRNAVTGDDEAIEVTEQALLGGREDEGVPEDLLEQGFGANGQRLVPTAFEPFDQALDDPRAIGCQFLALPSAFAGFAALATHAATGSLFAEPEAMLEVVKGADTRSIAGLETTEDGEQRYGTHGDNPVVDRGVAGQGHAEPAAQQVSGIPWRGATLGLPIAGQHQGVNRGNVGQPELGDEVCVEQEDIPLARVDVMTLQLLLNAGLVVLMRTRRRAQG